MIRPMRIFLKILFLAVALNGCTQIIAPIPKRAPEPYRDLNSFLHGNWILLAESSTKDWYYDPESIQMEQGGPITFWSYWTPKKIDLVDVKNSEFKQDSSSATLVGIQVSEVDTSVGSPFEPSAIGPYLQKIDCFTNTHLEESLIDGRCESSEISSNSQGPIKPDAVECWRNIKPKTAMAYIKTRVCGRRFVLENTTNYYLYQTNSLQSFNSPPGEAIDWGEIKKSAVTKKFYEVINNEYIVVDSENNIREMRIASYFLDKKGSYDAEYLYRANCQTGLDSLIKMGQFKAAMNPVGEPTSLSGVAFNRICGNHSEYMRQVRVYTKQ